LNKFLRFTIAAAVATVAAGFATAPVRAQDGNFGEFVEGSITFEGEAGEIILVEMHPAPGTYDLDPELALENSAGDVIYTNDDAAGLSAVIVTELEEAGEYTIVATRSGGEDGSSTGDFVLRVQTVTPVAVGETNTATITSVEDENLPQLLVYIPEGDTSATLSVEQQPDVLYAGIEVIQTSGEEFGDDTLFDLYDTSGLTNLTATFNVTGGEIYLIVIRNQAFAFEEASLDVTVTITE
jgi:hypothetical protein